MARAVKQGFDETCALWEERLDAALFPGRPAGTFRCRFLNDPLKVFEKWLDQHFYSYLVGTVRLAEIYDSLVRNAKRMDDHLVEQCLVDAVLNVMQFITQGASEGNRICWECGAKLATENECTGCRAALYCGRECQLKAWAKGHKTACSSLKDRHQAFVESLQAVDQAHQTGILEGTQLCHGADFNLLLLLNFMPPTQGFDESHPLGRPSMKYFYENLVRGLISQSVV